MPNLEIGCGSNPQPGYIHTDAFVDNSNRHLVDVVCDARDLPFPDKHFDNVLMFGVFEHFGIYEVQEALLEISRVLKDGGRFKFDVPDFEWFVKRYLDPNLLEEGRDTKWVLHAIFGGQDGPGHFHKWGWDESRLTEFLRKPNWEFSEVNLIGRQWRDPEANHLIYECRKGVTNDNSSLTT